MDTAQQMVKERITYGDIKRISDLFRSLTNWVEILCGGDEAAANRWLHTPHSLLGDRTPWEYLHVSDDGDGFLQIRRLKQLTKMVRCLYYRQREMDAFLERIFDGDTDAINTWWSRPNPHLNDQTPAAYIRWDEPIAAWAVERFQRLHALLQQRARALHNEQARA